MSPAEIRKVQAYMQKLFNNPDITISAPPRGGNGSCEVSVKGEFIGTIHRDEDEGEVSYDFNMAILEMDLV